MTIHFQHIAKEQNEPILLSLLAQFQVEQKAIDSQQAEIFSYAAFNEQKQQIGGVLATHWMNTCHIHLLAISTPYRGQGIGSQLLTRVESFAQSRNARFLTVHTQDYQAKTFYERFGYKVFGTIPDMPFEGTTKYYFVKDLSRS